MSRHLIMAWRNIWRNKRRALITISSVFFMVLLALIMRSMQLGSYEVMERNIVELYSGYIQIHDSSYWENKTINNTFEYSKETAVKLRNVENVSLLIPRLESFALASSGNLTKGILVMGIEPGLETQLTKLEEKVTAGKYLEGNDEGVMVADKLATYLSLRVGDTLVLISQGYHGVSAAGKYPVKAIIKFPNPDLSRQLVFMSLPACQDFFMAQGRLTSLVIHIEDPDKLDQTAGMLKTAIDPAFSVMTWREMMVDIVQMIESDNASGIIMLGLLYLVIAFGILGTVVMMTSERRKEFGVMVAVGMRRMRLAILIFTEALFLGILGTLAGTLVAVPLIYYYYLHPIPLSGEYAAIFEEYGFEAVYAFAFEPGFFISQAAAVVAITVLALIYPVISILRMKPVKAMRD